MNLERRKRLATAVAELAQLSIVPHWARAAVADLVAELHDQDAQLARQAEQLAELAAKLDALAGACDIQVVMMKGGADGKG
jgi:hypothetical protein